jgi:hypothetical protein
MDHQIHNSVRLKVGKPDRFDFALLNQFFHRTLFAIHIAKWLMDEIQVNVIQLQTFQGPFKGFERAFITIALDPEFCGDEQFSPCNAALFDTPANCFFVHVRGGGVNMTVSRFNGIHHASFTFGWISDLKNTETENGDFNAIVQFYSLHHFLLMFLLL